LFFVKEKEKGLLHGLITRLVNIIAIVLGIVTYLALLLGEARVLLRGLVLLHVFNAAELTVHRTHRCDTCRHTFPIGLREEALGLILAHDGVSLLLKVPHQAELVVLLAQGMGLEVRGHELHVGLVSVHPPEHGERHPLWGVPSALLAATVSLAVRLNAPRGLYLLEDVGTAALAMEHAHRGLRTKART
jgi:hypothetical protein